MEEEPITIVDDQESISTIHEQVEDEREIVTISDDSSEASHMSVGSDGEDENNIPWAKNDMTALYLAASDIMDSLSARCRLDLEKPDLSRIANNISAQRFVYDTLSLVLEAKFRDFLPVTKKAKATLAADWPKLLGYCIIGYGLETESAGQQAYFLMDKVAKENYVEADAVEHLKAVQKSLNNCLEDAIFAQRKVQQMLVIDDWISQMLFQPDNEDN